MRIALDIDDKRFQHAARFLGTVLNVALRALVERERAQRLARLGGTDPDVNQAPRRQSRKGPLEP